MTITIHRLRWTYHLRIVPRSSVAALRVATAIAELGDPHLSVRYCGANEAGGFVEIEDQADQTRTVEEFVDLVRRCCGAGLGTDTTVVAAPAPVAGRGASC